MKQFFTLVDYYDSLYSLEELILFADIVIPILHYFYLVPEGHLTQDILDDQLWLGMFRYDDRTSPLMDAMKQKMIDVCALPLQEREFDVKTVFTTLPPLQLDRWSSVIQWACLYGKYKKYHDHIISISIRGIIQGYMISLVHQKMECVEQYIEYFHSKNETTC